MEKSVKVFGNDYFFDSFFNEKKKPKPVKYNKNHLQIGYVVKHGQVTKDIYTLDIEESFRACILGATRCLPLGTLVKTKEGYIPIEKVKKVLSYNFEKETIEEKDCELHFFGKRKKTVIITSLGDIFCSDNHEWFVKREGKIVELEAKKLLKTDKLLRFEEKLLEVDIFSVAFFNEDVEMVCLEVKDNHNFFIEDMILSKNSGKSFLLRGLSDRYAKLGNAVVNLNDTKGEMASSLLPVQDKFKHLLLPGETPQGFKILPLRPTFFRQIDEELKPNHHWYSIDGRAMTRADFMTLMNARSLPPNQQTALEVVYQELQRKLIHDKELRLDVDLINQIIDEEEDIVPATKRSLKFKFRPLQDSHFFVKEEEKNIVNAIKNGFIPCINVENFDSFGEGSFQFTEVLLSMVFREVRIARRAKKIPRVLVNFDEASRFIGNSRETSIKTEMLGSHDLDAKYKVDICTIWQSMTDIPERILQQSRYIFVPNTADVRTIQTILVNTSKTKNVQTSVRDAMYLKKELQKVKYSWVVIDRMNMTKKVFIPFAPLSRHTETGE